MPKDQEEALQRLEEALLEEGAAPEEDVAEDTAPAASCVVYRNYSNGYGKDLRNFASGYRTYDPNVCDEQLPTGRRRSLFPLAMLLLILTAGILAVLVWYRVTR